MAALILAGVFVTVLTVSGSAYAAGQTGPPASVGKHAQGPLPSRSIAGQVRPSGEPLGSVSELAPGTTSAWDTIRFGRAQTPRVIVDSANKGPCRPPASPRHWDPDPGIYMPPRDPHIDFTIRRAVPKGCIDPGIFPENRKK